MFRAWLTVLLLAVMVPVGALANPVRADHPRWDPEFHQAHLLLASSGKRWQDMTPEEREEVRRRKAQYDSLPAREQRRLRKAQEDYESMPAERRREIRERWDKMSPEEKRRYRLEQEEQRNRR